MKKVFDVSYKLRWVMLLIGLTCLMMGLSLICWLLWFPKVPELYPSNWFIQFITFGLLEITTEWVISTAVFLGIAILVQWLFLRPRREWRIRLADTGRPLNTAVAAAAFMAMLLSVGLFVTLMEIYTPDSWGEALNSFVFYSIVLVLWVLWAVVFYVYWQQSERFAQLSKMISGLIVGSFLELFIAIGVYAWNPQDNDNSCICERGSYTGLVFAATVMIWVFGPGLILLFIKKQQDRKLRQSSNNS
jgi:hypothetical protein